MRLRRVASAVSENAGTVVSGGFLVVTALLCFFSLRKIAPQQENGNASLENSDHERG